MKPKAMYKGKSGAAILKTARVAQMRAGNYEVVVTLDGREVVANLGSRGDGWGGTVSDVLVLADADGIIGKLQLSNRGASKLASLVEQTERKYATER